MVEDDSYLPSLSQLPCPDGSWTFDFADSAPTKVTCEQSPQRVNIGSPENYLPLTVTRQKDVEPIRTSAKRFKTCLGSGDDGLTERTLIGFALF